MTNRPSYAPDHMLIKLPDEMAAVIDLEENKLVLEEPRLASLFLHEWLHYLHNISTVTGVQAFASMIHLWTCFRWTIDEHGVSVEYPPLLEQHASEIARVQALLKAARGASNPEGNPTKRTGTDWTILTSQRLEGNEAFHVTVIQCETLIDDTPVIAHVGTFEILEGVASMLETRYLRLHGESPSPASISPYQLLQKLARSRVPDIEDDDAAAAGLFALQSSDPPYSLLDILDALRNVPIRSRRAWMERQLSLHLAAERPVLEALLAQTEEHFPRDEPMAAAVKTLVGLMRDLMTKRQQDPFFELTLLDRLAKEPVEVRAMALTQEMAALAPARIMQSHRHRPGDILFFGKPGDHSEELAFGQHTLHAAFHFLKLHLNGIGFSLGEIKQKGQSCQCPFFSVCTYPLRRVHPEICEAAPWASLNVPTAPTEACWYRAGVRATGAPQDEKIDGIRT